MNWKEYEDFVDKTYDGNPEYAKKIKEMARKQIHEEEVKAINEIMEL